MSMTTLSPVFVVGTPRSGTTLTAKILGRHSDLFMPGETHYFDDIFARSKTLGSPSTTTGSRAIADRLMTLYARFNEPDDQLRVDQMMAIDELALDIREQCSDYADVLSLFMQKQMAGTNKRRWGNNTPRDLFNLEAIAAFYPDARIIICVRDPRDFLGSYKGKWHNTAAEEVTRLKKLYHPVVTSYLWKANMNIVHRAVNYFPADQIIVMKYEELVSNPQRTIQLLCDHINVDYQPSMIELSFSNSSTGDTAAPAIFTSSIDLWKKRISAEEAYITQTINAHAMQAYGYAPAALDVNWLIIIANVFSTPFALLKALHANRNKRGPLIPYLLKRFGFMH